MKKTIICVLGVASLTMAQAQTKPGGISSEMLRDIQKEQKAEPVNRALVNAVAANSIDALTVNHQNAGALDTYFSIETPKQSITDQKSSGRCWMFSGLNVLRSNYTKERDSIEVEFSQAYLFFWDQLEKANLMLQGCVDTGHQPIDDPRVQFFFKSPIGDGGTFCGVADLVDKYGLVPAEVMPETYTSDNTSKARSLISSKLREYGLQLRDMAQKDRKQASIDKAKTRMLSQIYKMLVMTIGEPPQQFTYAFKDKNGKAVGPAKTYTPQTFSQEVVGGPINGTFIMAMNDPRRPYYKTYEVEYDRHTYDGHNWKYVNLPMEDIEQMAIASLKDGRKLYSSYDVGKFLDRKRGYADTENYDYASLFGTTFGMDKAQRISTFDSGSTHAMTLTAVDLDEKGKVKKWKVENSWGASWGQQGCLIMTDRWFREFMFRLVVNKKYVPENILQASETEPVMVMPEDPLFLPDEQPQRENPLLVKSTLPFGAPDFSRIQASDYLPAFEIAIQQNREEIAAIVTNPESPTFKNTILALEESGKLLDRVSGVFFALVSADKTPEIGEIQKKVMPMLTDLSNEIMFNKQLFERIKQVYDKEHDALQGEDKKLLEETYKGFVRRGALLSEDKMKRMKEINLRISELQQNWGDLLQAATNDAVVWVDKQEDLAGLSEADIAQCKKDAESRGGKAPYAIVIVNTTQQPILASLDNRELRKKVFEASVHRADGTGQYNTFSIVSEVARLRAEQAEIMGYPNYASYSLERAMAKTPDNVYAFLKNLISQYSPKADAETKAIEDFARKTAGPDFQLQPYDRFYYSAKMKKELLNVSDDEVKPYFNVDSVLINGVFYAANRVYGLTFKERKDIPLYHPDMQAFEVIDKDGRTLALFCCDYYRRPTKRGGAWMNGFQKQSRQRNQIPIVFNVCNNAKAPDGMPSLLTWDEVTTMFHEFGHALHGMLSNCQYNSLSGTSVARDFVEMPSQFNESFASIPEVFDHYARHYETGEPMPADLKERMLKSINFQTAYALGENLAATCADIAWHMLPSKDIPTADKADDFETEALRQIGLLNPQIPPRYHTSYFNHVWGGGYAAGYYSYLWTEVLAVNIADVFAQRGALKPETGQDFRDKILSRGNTGDLMQMFTDFTGMAQPDASSLLKARGL